MDQGQISYRNCIFRYAAETADIQERRHHDMRRVQLWNISAFVHSFLGVIESKYHIWRPICPPACLRYTHSISQTLCDMGLMPFPQQKLVQLRDINHLTHEQATLEFMRFRLAIYLSTQLPSPRKLLAPRQRKPKKAYTSSAHLAVFWARRIHRFVRALASAFEQPWPS